MILGNSFFEFLSNKFNSNQLLFFAIGVLIGVVIAFIIFLIISKTGKQEIVKQEIDVDKKNELIIYYQNQFDKTNGDIKDYLNSFKDLMVDMILDIATSISKDKKTPLYNISVDNIIIGVNRIVEDIYELLDNFSVSIKNANNDLIGTKKNMLNEQIKEYENIIENKKNNLLVLENKLKEKNVGFIKKTFKKYDEDYKNIKEEYENEYNAYKETIKSKEKLEKELNNISIDDHLSIKNKVIDKVAVIAKDRILEMKLLDFFNDKNNNIVIDKSKTSIIKMAKDKITNVGINVAVKAFGVKDIFKGIIPIIANNVYEIYR